MSLITKFAQAEHDLHTAEQRMITEPAIVIKDRSRAALGDPDNGFGWDPAAAGRRAVATLINKPLRPPRCRARPAPWRCTRASACRS